MPGSVLGPGATELSLSLPPSNSLSVVGMGNRQENQSQLSVVDTVLHSEKDTQGGLCRAPRREQVTLPAVAWKVSRQEERGAGLCLASSR